MNNVKELSKVQQDQETGLWMVLILSPVHGRWIVQGEWATKQEAETDRKNWM